MIVSLTPIIERFEAHVIRADDGHWYWTGATSHGYGALALGRKQDGNIPAHVFSYELYVGPVPYGFVVDHTCRVSLCVNPADLEAVPQAINCRRGSKARLSMTEAEEIRALFASGVTQPAIAEMFGTTPQYVSLIVRGKRWSPEIKLIRRTQRVNPFVAKALRDELAA